MDEPAMVFTPGEAARRLGVTTQSLRRYADDYAEVFDPIPVMHRQRVFDGLIVRRLQVAQELLREQVVPSIKAGLERVRDGDPSSGPPIPVANTPFELQVLQHLEAVASEVAAMRRENQSLREEVAELRAARELPAEPDDSENAKRAREAERMNAYLLGELERRRLEAEQQPVRRWRWPWANRR